MKVVLTKDELARALRAVYQPAAGYSVGSVEINGEYGVPGYCVIELIDLPPTLETSGPGAAG